MKKFLIAIPPLLLISSLLTLHCSGSAVNLQESYQKLSPLKPVEFPEPAEDNLIVTIANIADERASYKNRIEFYVNQKRIQPSWLPSNLDRKNVYSLRLKPGYYDVQAVYYATVGWGEEKYIISNTDLISVPPDQRTLLNCVLTKKTNGALLSKNPHFTITYEPIAQTHSVGTPAAQTEAKANKTAVMTLAQSSKREAEEGDTFLQINTIPENARVFVDDKLVGQSPRRLKIDPTVDHAVQISCEGYQTVVKYVDHTGLKTGTNFLLIELQK